MKNTPCDILVATPGRLIQHLEEGDMRHRLEGCKFLIFDEADRLLEMGFKPAIDKIMSYVPKNRQTLLYSATVSEQIQKVAANTLRPGHVYIDCVGEADSATNLQVKQSLVGHGHGHRMFRRRVPAPAPRFTAHALAFSSLQLSSAPFSSSALRLFSSLTLQIKDMKNCLQTLLFQ